MDVELRQPIGRFTIHGFGGAQSECGRHPRNGGRRSRVKRQVRRGQGDGRRERLRVRYVQLRRRVHDDVGKAPAMSGSRMRMRRLICAVAASALLGILASSPVAAAAPANDDIGSARVVGAIPYADGPYDTTEATTAPTDPGFCSTPSAAPTARPCGTRSRPGPRALPRRHLHQRLRHDALRRHLQRDRRHRRHRLQRRRQRPAVRGGVGGNGRDHLPDHGRHVPWRRRFRGRGWQPRVPPRTSRRRHRRSRSPSRGPDRSRRTARRRSTAPRGARTPTGRSTSTCSSPRPSGDLPSTARGSVPSSARARRRHGRWT